MTDMRSRVTTEQFPLQVAWAGERNKTMKKHIGKHIWLKTENDIEKPSNGTAHPEDENIRMHKKYRFE